MRSVEIVGTGSYLPAEPVSNEQLSAVFGREITWLAEMLGVQYRHFAIDLDRLELSPGETNAAMATKAARQALLDARVNPSSIDLMIMATSTPDYPFPATALFVQEQLELPDCCVIELRAGCGGMAQALMIATHMIAADTVKTALLIGSELISSLIAQYIQRGQTLDQDYLVSIALFGDGAGAMVLSAGEGDGGILDCMSRSVGVGRPPGMLLREGGALSSKGPLSGEDQRRHVKVFSHDFKAIVQYGPDLLEAACRWLRDEKKYDFSQVDFFIPPQINSQVIALLAENMGIPISKVVSNIGRVGNTVSASIYIALDQMNREGMVQPGNILILFPMEATKWVTGAVVLQWTKQRGQHA